MTAKPTSSPSTTTRKTYFVQVAAVFAAFLVARSVAASFGVPLAGPIGTLAALTMIGLVRGRDSADAPILGLGMPKPIGRAIAVFLVVLGLTAVLGIVVLPWLTSVLGDQEASARFDYMRGNLALFLLSVVTVAWFAAAFGEEVVWRGFLLPRVVEALGGQPWTWPVTIVLLSGVFGAVHTGASGQILAMAIGVVYGTAYWLGLRNLWPLIAAHAVPDTMSFLAIFQGS